MNTEISLHEFGVDENGKSRSRFEILSSRLSDSLLQLTSRLRSIDHEISILQGGLSKDNDGDNDDDSSLLMQIDEVGEAIIDLDEDLKELDSVVNGMTSTSYKDDINEHDQIQKQKQQFVVEKLSRGVNEIQMLFEKMKGSVFHTRDTSKPIQDDYSTLYQQDGEYRDDGNISSGVIGGKTFQIQHTSLNAEELEQQHYEAVQREAEINKIVNSVGELNQIFHDMDQLVISQGEIVDNIENNIYSTLDNTRYADRELRKANNWDKRRRRYSCVLMVVAAIVIFILLALIA